MGLEWLRAQGELGFPWFHLGYTQWNVLPVLQLATWSGVSSVGLFVAIVNGLALAAVRAQAPRARVGFALGAAVVLALPFALVRLPKPAVDTTPIGLVQGNVPGKIKWSGRHEDEVLAKFMVLSRAAVVRGARFVLWPETSTGSYLRQNLDQRMRLQAFVDSLGVGVLAGYPDYRFTGPKTYLSWNAAGVFWPSPVFGQNTGLGPQYAKMHLVPFGERMPFQGIVPAIGKLELGQAEWTPGTDPSPLPTPLGPAGAGLLRVDLCRTRAPEVPRGATGWSTSPTTSGSIGAARSPSTPRWRCSARSNTACRSRAAPTPA
jgi:apolipoprotein N-acyltransferase